MVANHSTVQIELAPGERFTEQVVEEGNHDPYGHLKIHVDGVYLIGSEDTNVGVWMTTDLIRLLAQTEAIFDGEKNVVAFDNGPSYLVAESVDDGKTVNVTQCLLYSGVEEPDKRLPIEETFTVSKRAWAEELVRVTGDYLEKVTDLNPELEDNQYVQELRAEVAGAKARLRTSTKG